MSFTTAVGLSALLDDIGNQWHGLTGRMTAAIFLGILDTVEFKHRGLLLIAIPCMLAILTPAPDNWFMDVLPIGARKHQPVFFQTSPAPTLKPASS